VKAFERGGAGPDDEHPKWDMMGMKDSLWNDTGINILVEWLLGNFRQQSLQFLPKSRKYWKDAIREKFTQIKAVWMRAQPQMTDTGQIENPNKVKKCRIELDKKRLKQIRIQEWRVNVITHVKKEANVNDVDTWKWLSNVLEQLGPDGMSSDESMVKDDIHIVFLTKKMSCRRDIKRELDLIDIQ
ncbi:hypothetical protein HD554DRAFT_2027540, partial [Boletus coccyginus]